MNIEPFIFLGFQKFFQQRDIPMYITCLDLEGVLVPEIWIAFSEVSGIPELRRTTRDEPDYDKLMRWRMDILREHGLGLKQIQDVIAQIDPLPGAKDFLDELRAQTQAIIVSDTFEEFAQPLMKKLGRRSSAIRSRSTGTGCSAASKCAARIPSLRPSGRCSPWDLRPSLPATATTIWK